MSGNGLAIRFNHVSKSFGSLTVLDDVSFEVPAGQTLCILGRSGTGKSVALKHLLGLIKPDKGTVFVEGQEITNLDARGLSQVRKRIGYLFQYSALFDSKSVGENVAFPLQRHTQDSDSEIRNRAQTMLDRVGLQDVYDRMPSEISGGMRKRAGLARALIMNPSILLVDEPSSGLDPITSAEIDELLMELKTDEGTTLVVVTHNIPSARRIGDQLALLHQGHILARGTPQEFADSEQPIVRDFMRVAGGT